jgi:hypothetical protein
MFPYASTQSRGDASMVTALAEVQIPSFDFWFVIKNNDDRFITQVVPILYQAMCQHLHHMPVLSYDDFFSDFCEEADEFMDDNYMTMLRDYDSEYPNDFELWTEEQQEEASECMADEYGMLVENFLHDFAIVCDYFHLTYLTRDSVWFGKRGILSIEQPAIVEVW